MYSSTPLQNHNAKEQLQLKNNMHRQTMKSTQAPILSTLKTPAKKRCITTIKKPHLNLFNINCNTPTTTTNSHRNTQPHSKQEKNTNLHQ